MRETFRGRLDLLEPQLTSHPWLLGELTHADIMLLSCLKCFATVMRGVEHVIAEERFPAMTAWYKRQHEVYGIEDPY